MKKGIEYQTLDDLQAEYLDALHMREHFTKVLDRMLNYEDSNQASQEDVDRCLQQRAHYALLTLKAKDAVERMQRDLAKLEKQKEKKRQLTLQDYDKKRRKKAVKKR